MQACGITKSVYYYKPVKGKDKRRQPLDEFLVKKLKELKGYENTYGYRKVTKKLGKYNHKKVYRHMKKLNILQPIKLKKKKHKRLPIECAIEANVRWETDLTYIYDGSRINYLFTVIDTYDKEIIGDYYGLRCRAKEALEALEKAVKNRFGSLESCEDYLVSLRLDQGSQFTSQQYKDRAKELGIKLEYCGIDCPDDKPYIESFFSRYKCEEVYRNEYISYSHALINWIGYKSWYNNERIHQGLNYKTIPEFKKKRFKSLSSV